MLTGSLGPPHTLPLPPTVADLLTGIDRGEVLGASRQLVVLGDALLGIAAARRTDPTRLRQDVARLLEHVTRTRGASSHAVVNGMALMTRGLLVLDDDADSAALGAELTAAVEDFRTGLARWLEDLRRHGVRVLSGSDVVLAYDYSSTVAQVLADVAAGRDGLRVFVPEARSLDGGLKYLPDWRGLGLTVHLIPDSAVGWAVASCDAVVVGAETLSAEGGCYNTVGTATTAREAKRIGVPVHVLSVLLKTDLGSAGAARPIPSLDFLDRVGTCATDDGSGLTLRGDFPDLDYTPPQDIADVVTEAGVLPPAQVRAAAERALRTGGQHG